MRANRVRAKQKERSDWNEENAGRMRMTVKRLQIEFPFKFMRPLFAIEATANEHQRCRLRRSPHSDRRLEWTRRKSISSESEWRAKDHEVENKRRFLTNILCFAPPLKPHPYDLLCVVFRSDNLSVFRTDSFAAGGQWLRRRCRLQLKIGWLRCRFGFPFDHFDLFGVKNESLGTCFLLRWMDLSALKIHSVDPFARHIRITYSIDVLCVQTATSIEPIDFSFCHPTLRTLTCCTASCTHASNTYAPIYGRRVTTELMNNSIENWQAFPYFIYFINLCCSYVTTYLLHSTGSRTESHGSDRAK